MRAQLLDCLVMLSGTCLEALPSLKAYHKVPLWPRPPAHAPQRMFERPALQLWFASPKRAEFINGNQRQ